MLKIDAKFEEGKVKNLEEELNDVERDVLRLQIYFSHLEAQPEKLKQIPTQDWEEDTHRIESIGKNRKLFHEYKEEVINKEFKTNISTIIIYDYKTIHKLSSYIDNGNDTLLMKNIDYTTNTNYGNIKIKKFVILG